MSILKIIKISYRLIIYYVKHIFKKEQQKSLILTSQNQ